MKTTGRGACIALALLCAAGCARRTVGLVRPPAAQRAAVSVMRQQIINAADAGEGDPVVNRLRRQMAVDPDDVALRLQLAAHYRKIGLSELEMEHLRLAVERFPESREAHMALAAALRQASLPRRAAEPLEAFARNHPAAADPELLNRLAICYDEAGDWKAGERAYREALAVAPSLDYLHNNLGYNLLQQQRVAEGINEFREALESNPDSMVARNNLGSALARTSVAEALAHFQNVVDTATAYNNLAAALIEQNRYQESRQLLQAALDYNRSHAAALANLKLVSELDGKPAELKLRPSAHRRWWPLAVLKKVFAVSEPRPAGSGS